MEIRSELQAKQAYEQLEPVLQSLPPAEAIAKIELFISNYPEYAQAHNDLGVLHYQLDNKLQTLGRYERAVHLAPKNQTFRKNLASFYYVELGWGDDAITLYTELLKEAPNDIDVLSALALISREYGHSDESRTFLQRIIILQPGNQDAREMLDSLNPSRSSAQAEPPTVSAAEAAELDRLMAELSHSLAGPATSPLQPAKTSADKLTAQINDIESQLVREPTNAAAHNDLGVLLVQKGDFAMSLAHHEMACRLAPDNLTYLKNLAGILTCTDGNIDKAIDLLTQALKKYPADTEILAALGNICLQVGRPEEALIFLRRVLDIEPWNQEARSITAQLQNTDIQDFFLSH